MQLKDCFDFQNPNSIRIKGTRVGLEHVIYVIREGMTAEQIQQEFPSLSLEQVHACLTYYGNHLAEADAYIARKEAEWESERQQAEWDEVMRYLAPSNRSVVVKRVLRELDREALELHPLHRASARTTKGNQTHARL